MNICFKTMRRRRRWECKNKVTLRVDTPDKKTRSKTKKYDQKQKRSIVSMDMKKKKTLLEGQNILKPNSKAPDDIIDTILLNIV